VCTSDLSTLLRIELLGRQSPALSTGRLPHSHKTVLFFPTINRIRGAIRLGDPLPWTRSTARPLTGTPEGPPATAGPCRPAARAPRLPPLAAAALPPLLVYYRYSILGGGPSRALPLLLQTAASSGSASQGEREAAAAPCWHWQRCYNGSAPRTPCSVDTISLFCASVDTICLIVENNKAPAEVRRVNDLNPVALTGALRWRSFSYLP
jgi:hypothetical protein